LAGEHASLYALDAHSGAKLWSFATGNGIIPAPSVAHEHVYVGSDDANLYAFGL
jgi:outer membrane protein assembly factor BamB